MKIDVDYIRRRIYLETGYYGWGQLMLENIEAGAIQEQTAIAKSILEGDNSKAFNTLDEIEIFDDVISLYTEIDVLGAPFTAPVERDLREIHAKFTDETFDSLNRETRIAQLKTLEVNFPMHLESEKEARSEAEHQRIAHAQQAEAQKSQIEIERKLLIVNEEANRLLQVYTESDIVRPFDEVLEVAAETFNIDLKVLTAIAVDNICEDTTNPKDFTSEALSNWRLKLMSIRQGIEQRSEWSKSMMRDVSGCRAALQWTLKMELKLTNDVVDIPNLSDTHNLTHDEVVALKDTVFADSLADAKDRHKAVRKGCRETWQNDTELSESVKWKDVCINACRVYPDLSMESFNGVRTTPDYSDYQVLMVEIARLESMKADILNRAEWVASLIPDPNAPAQSYKITSVAINVVESDTDVDEYKDRVTVYLNDQYIVNPNNPLASKLPDALKEQLTEIATQAIESQE